MTVILYAEVNIICIIVLILLLSNLKLKVLDKPLNDQKIFNYLLIVDILILIFDMGMWLFDNRQFTGAMILNTICTTIYYILNPFICFLWIIYTDYKLHQNTAALMKRMPLYIIPVTVNIVIAVSSPITGWLFEINTQNHYTRGNLFFIMALAALIYLIASLIITLFDVRKNGYIYEKNIYLHLMLFPVIMILASIIQILFFGLSIIWACSMLFMLSMYIHMQNSEIFIDHLTRLYNRRRYDTQLKLKTKTFLGKNILFLLMLDVDDFKAINDTFGHTVGDEALVSTAELLRACCKYSDDFIARIGGDEFVIIGERRNEDDVKKLIEKIENQSYEFNSKQKAQYKLSFSMGHAIYKKGGSINDLLAAADSKMYAQKSEHKKQVKSARSHNQPDSAMDSGTETPSETVER